MSLQVAAAILFKWFPASYMKGNTYKCHLLMNKYGSREIHIDKLTDCWKLLGFKVDSKLRSDSLVEDLCKKVKRKSLKRILKEERF